MVFCRECGLEITEDDKFCNECGANQLGKNIKSSTEEVDETTWGLVAFFLPIVGFIAGVIFAIQGKKNAWGIVFFSIICFIIWYFIIMVYWGIY